MKMVKILKIIFVLAFLFQGFGTVILIGAPVDAQAAGPGILKSLKKDPIDFEPQVGIPDSDFATPVVKSGTYTDGKTSSDLLAKYIQAIYKYALTIVGILAAIVLMAGGVLWLTSAGNDTKIAQAKELILGSIIGTAILFGSYVILNTVNPELLALKAIRITALDEMTLDEDDGIVDNLNSLPTDTKYKWVCTNNNLQLCEDTDPPTINLGNRICETGKPQNTKPTNCPLGQLWCCGLSDTITQQANNACVGKPDHTTCKINVASVSDGVCLQEKCVSKKVKTCCQCGQGCIAGFCASVTCRNDISVNECASWCTNSIVGAGYNAFYGGSQNYTCAGGAMSYCKKK